MLKVHDVPRAVRRDHRQWPGLRHVCFPFSSPPTASMGRSGLGELKNLCPPLLHKPPHPPQHTPTSPRCISLTLHLAHVTTPTTPHICLLSKCFNACRYLHAPLRVLPAGATSCRAGITPAEDQRLITAHQDRWIPPRVHSCFKAARRPIRTRRRSCSRCRRAADARRGPSCRWFGRRRCAGSTRRGRIADPSHRSGGASAVRARP